MHDMDSQVDARDQHNGNWHILLLGLPGVTVSRNLAPGITLRPISDPLTVFDLADAGAAGFRSWAVLEPMAAMCTCEIESACDAAVNPGYDTLNRAWLASALLVLRGFSRHLCVACSGYSWREVAGHQKRTAPAHQKQIREEGLDKAIYNSKCALPPFRGDLLDFHLKMIVSRSSRTDGVSSDDAQWVREHFDAFNEMAASSASFRFALESSIDWRYAKDGRSAIARLWSGIEAFFGISSELVYRISLLSAALLVPRRGDRKQKFNEVKKLYGLRSKAVHGSQLSDEKMETAVDGSFQLLADLLMVAIECGHALSQDDFDKAVFE